MMRDFILPLTGIVVGWLIGFMPLWIFGWGPQLGGLWSGAVIMITMIIGLALAFVVLAKHDGLF